MNFCVGLTGSIASGKSTVARFFSELGIAIISADLISRKSTEKGTSNYQKIVTHFGPTIINKEDRQLNRRRLREIIFSNPHEKTWLEQLLHPMIRQEIAKQVTESTSQYCIVEIPLLIDKKNYPYVNRILVVTSPLETQIERIINRDKCTKEQALAIIANQATLSQRLEHADDLLTNDSDTGQLKQNVEQLHYKYLSLSR